MNLAERWPADVADNIERLKNAGQPYDRHIMKCRNCGGKTFYTMAQLQKLVLTQIGMGHSSRTCREERVEYERIVIKCINCGAFGHRVRDCTEPRKTKDGCRNCGYVSFHDMVWWTGNANHITYRAHDHDARDCPEPRSAAGIECRQCNESQYPTPLSLIDAIVTILTITYSGPLCQGLPSA